MPSRKLSCWPAEVGGFRAVFRPRDPAGGEPPAVDFPRPGRRVCEPEVQKAPEEAPPTDPGRTFGIPGWEAGGLLRPAPAGRDSVEEARLAGAGLPGGDLPELRGEPGGFTPSDYRPGPSPDSILSTSLLLGMKSAREGSSDSAFSPICSKNTWEVP